MPTLTNNAMFEIEREKDFSPENTLGFLRKRENFITLSEGIKRELKRLGYDGDDKQLFAHFNSVLEKAGFTYDDCRNAPKWFGNKVKPSPKYAIRLCFAFGLSGKAALDFLWKACKVNGFNFRRAEDVVCCYGLENGKSYAETVELIKRYKTHTAELSFEESDATKRTYTLRAVFNELKGMDEAVFFEKLCANKKNFIKYSKTAHEEFVRLYENLKETIREEIANHQNDHKYTAMEKYDSEPSVYPEIVYAFGKISAAAKSNKTKGSTFAHLAENFPQGKYLNSMFNIPSEATDKEYDKARKAFILLYFADYTLDPPPDGFYDDFYIALNTMLDKCGYAKLYPANPYDWLILNCVKSLDVNDQTEDLNPVELFNEVLELLADESNR